VTLAAASASVIVFAVALWLFGVIRVGSGVLVTARSALAAISDESLDDLAREKAVQKASLSLLGAFVSIALRSILALLASFLPIWLASLTGRTSVDEVMQFLSRWDVVLIASLLMIAVYVIGRRLWPSA
jgi:hypothetical protein